MYGAFLVGASYLQGLPPRKPSASGNLAAGVKAEHDEYLTSGRPMTVRGWAA
jgi:hypothetical protein